MISRTEVNSPEYTGCQQEALLYTDLFVIASFVDPPQSLIWLNFNRNKEARHRWVSMDFQKQPAFIATQGTKVVIWQVVFIPTPN